MIRLLFVSALAAASAQSVYAQVPSGPCKPVFDAMVKVTTTPHHAVTIRNGGAASESIATADAMYVKVKGQWRKSPMTPKGLLEQQIENIHNTTTASCTVLRDEFVEGTPTTVYRTHYEQKDLGASEATVWIGKATGLPIRTDVTMQAGEKTAVTTQFDYDHITAPPLR